jgi:molybdate/tungstate transport system substrate-binding protein
MANAVMFPPPSGGRARVGGIQRGLAARGPALVRALALCALLALAACGSSGPALSAGSPATAAPAPKASGTVSVFYAASLVNLMEHEVGPQFAAGSGARYQGYAAGSSAIANQIKGKLRQGDVFISAAPAVNATLEGAANGDWVSWYATFARAPLVIGYDPKSRFAADLRSRPWYQALTEPGIKLGRTDPKLDPKGQLTVQALQQAEASYGQPGLAARVEAAAQVFPEEDLVGRLQSGQLDAGFFYSNEAKEANIPTVPLDKVSLSATYTVTILNRAPNRAGGIAFVRYLLGPPGRTILQRHGLSVVPYQVSGEGSAVPAALRSLLGAGASA